MDEKTLTALKASIEKWERNAVAETPADAHVNGDTCALCNLFDEINDDGGCAGCPVAEATGEEECAGSPWYDARIAKNRWLRGDVDAEHFHAAAREEVAFLKSLLPASEQSS